MRFLSQTALCLITAAGLLMTGCTVSTVRKPESSAEESSLTDFVNLPAIVPTQRPTELTLQIPEGFTEKSSDYCNQFYVRDDASIIITSEKQAIHGIRLDEFAAETKFSYEQTADNYLLNDEQETTINGKKCVMLDFTYDIIGTDKTQKMHAMTALFMENNISYVVTCKSRAETYASYAGLFDRAIRTITISPPAEDAATTLPSQTSPAPQMTAATTTEPSF